jgi:peptide chain release factor 1
LGFAKLEWFTVEILDESNIDGGWLKLLVAKISGFWAFSRFKFEGGTHRVQRIPETETKWRVHTSTVTVAVLPEVEAVDLVIRDEDLEITATRASGAGGQHVNKTSSAIRMVHKPSWLVVECQDERSQIQNKAKALAILRARLYAQEEEKRSKAIGEARLSQVGTGDRSEKIRTYNYPQDRVTDHRIGQNFSNLPGIMMGNLAPLIDAITIEEQTRLLEQAGG